MALDSVNTRPPANREEFWARFFWGALFGLVAGSSFCLGQESPSWHEWLAIPGCSLLFGAAAGWSGDRFWYTLLRLFRW